GVRYSGMSQNSGGRPWAIVCTPRRKGATALCRPRRVADLQPAMRKLPRRPAAGTVRHRMPCRSCEKSALDRFTYLVHQIIPTRLVANRVWLARPEARPEFLRPERRLHPVLNDMLLTVPIGQRISALVPHALVPALLRILRRIGVTGAQDEVGAVGAALRNARRVCPKDRRAAVVAGFHAIVGRLVLYCARRAPLDVH